MLENVVLRSLRPLDRKDLFGLRIRERVFLHAACSLTFPTYFNFLFTLRKAADIINPEGFGS